MKLSKFNGTCFKSQNTRWHVLWARFEGRKGHGWVVTSDDVNQVTLDISRVMMPSRVRDIIRKAIEAIRMIN